MLYRDRFIECTTGELRIRWYYFPFGTRRIPYSAIRSISRFQLSALGGKGRIWGTGNFRYWANLDPSRPHKEVGLIVDAGKGMKAFITPDEPDTVAEVLSERAGVVVRTAASL